LVRFLKREFFNQVRDEDVINLFQKIPSQSYIIIAKVRISSILLTKGTGSMQYCYRNIDNCINYGLILKLWFYLLFA
jgi:hypothetical protein